MRALSSAVRLAACVTVCLVGAAQRPARAQSAEAPIRGTVEVGVVVQRYSADADQTVRETSAPFGVIVRHTSGVGAYVRGLYAAAGGDALGALSGVADVQGGVSYRRRFSGAVAEVSLAASAPGRGSALTDPEFATATALTFDDYAFDTPTLGQGATIAPAATVVLSGGRGVALGAGVAYFARAAFTPFVGGTASTAAPAEYSPADELVLTGGLTAQTGRASTVAFDAVLVSYGDDSFNGLTFSPGNRLSGTIRWAIGGGPVRGRFVAHYRHVFDGAVGARAVGYQRPEHAMLTTGVGVYRGRSGVEVTAGARYFGVFQQSGTTLGLLNVLGEQQLLVDVGAAPTVDISPGVALSGAFTYSFGVIEAVGAAPLSGFRAGAGLRATF